MRYVLLAIYQTTPALHADRVPSLLIFLRCPSLQVGWLKAKDQTILALHKRVITHNARIDVDHEEDRSVGRSPALNELRLGMGRLYRTNESMILTSNHRRIWQLKIRQVQESDRGCYMCQINTEEMKKQIGCIDVLSE